MWMLRDDAHRRRPGHLMRAAIALMLAGSLYRFDVYLLAFDPGAHWSYFPSVAELLITVGLVAGEIAAFIVLVRVFPILAGPPRPGAPQEMPS
jgi:Ni/Fe-hydrogenase subunit HybB-like protein